MDMSGRQVGDQGRYVFEQRLGAGAMGEVYIALDQRLRKRVVLKVMKPEWTSNPRVRERFRNEALIQANLEHPNVVRALDLVDEPDVLAIVMEYVDGASLEDLLAEVRGPMPPGRIVALLTPVLDVMELAHSKGVVHRDLKPANILLDRTLGREVPRVADFGIAKLLDQADRGMTREGAVLGTPTYMSPEQLKGVVDLDGRTDVYALGVILHQMASGTVPHGEANDYEVGYRIMAGERLPALAGRLAGVPTALDEVVARATEADRDKRYPSIRALRDDLLRIRVDSALEPAVRASAPPSEARPTPGAAVLEETAVPVSSALSRGPFLAGLAIGAVLLMGGLGWAVSNRPDPETSEQVVAELPVKESSTGGGFSEKKPRERIPISAGQFLMGTSVTEQGTVCRHQALTGYECEGEWFANAKVARSVTLAGYSMARAETTVAQYADCVEARACGAPEAGERCNWNVRGREQHPINCVSWWDAKAYCSWVGGRLPTEAEWEYAARGTDGRVYPWGDQPPSCSSTVWGDGEDADGCGWDSTWPVCSKESGNGPSGICDMAGNAWEWVWDWYDPAYYAKAPSVQPRGPGSGKRRVLRGGAWSSDNPYLLRCSGRGGAKPAKRLASLGFRCVWAD